MGVESDAHPRKALVLPQAVQGDMFKGKNKNVYFLMNSHLP